MREAIQRELEKERIREEIIAREIARRRLLEAEVRRELLMEQELMLTKTEFKSPVSSAMRLDRFPLFHQSDSRALEERLSRSLAQRLALQARQEMLAALETGTSFQRGVEAAGPEVKPFPEVNKDRVILLVSYRSYMLAFFSKLIYFDIFFIIWFPANLMNFLYSGSKLGSDRWLSFSYFELL